MLKRKVPIKIVKVKLHRDVKEFSVWHLLAFAVIFAGIGGYLIYHSFALTTCACGGAPPPPPPPNNLTETTLSGGIVNLSWTPPSDLSATSYKVYQTFYSEPDLNVTDLDQNNTGATSSDQAGRTSNLIGTTIQTNFQVTGLETDSAYDFYVVAVDSSGNASDPSNQVLADTSLPQPTTASSLNIRYATTSGTASTSFPYASPFGDQNCDSKMITSDTSDDCVQTCTGSANCGGSCIIVPPTNTLGNTGSCRPMSMQTCNFSDLTPADVPGPTLFGAQVDPGVDYNVTDPQIKYCKYNNPNPKDTGNSYLSQNGKTNTRFYAMGDGVITCVAATKGYGETLSLGRYCPGGSKVGLASGVGTWLVYKLTQKGAAQGLKIYVAESCNLSGDAINDITAPASSTDGNSPGHRNLGRRWKVGDDVNKNSVLCELRTGGVVEIGWANEGTQDMGSWSITNEIAPAAWKCYKEHDGRYGIWSTKWGYSFNLFALKSDFNRFNGPRGPYAYHDCADFRLQAKYKNSVWYTPPK